MRLFAAVLETASGTKRRSFAAQRMVAFGGKADTAKPAIATVFFAEATPDLVTFRSGSLSASI
jgi:hypothetical protein